MHLPFRPSGGRRHPPSCSANDEVPYTSADIVQYEVRVARVRGEVAEIRTAVYDLCEEGGAFLEEVAAFLDREALQLERAEEAGSGSAEPAEQEDTQERDGLVPTAARRTLLIARAFTGAHGTGGRG
ncbi:hypothetical protein ACIGQE_20465 [Streptomyces sp. NPDC053429]|uniref:hypothetical protein n=1 Tax=Streptomyces sp. NPDC053429 TaxID=3365702 RepID=UPI0037CE77D1